MEKLLKLYYLFPSYDCDYSIEIFHDQELALSRVVDRAAFHIKCLHSLKKRVLKYIYIYIYIYSYMGKLIYLGRLISTLSQEILKDLQYLILPTTSHIEREKL